MAEKRNDSLAADVSELIESPGPRLGRFQVLGLLMLIMLAGTALRLLVISQAAYVGNSGYSSYLKSTLNYQSANEDVMAGEGEWRDSSTLYEKLFVLEEGEIDFKALFQELVRSNHPPLYYYILHVAIGMSQEKEATLGIGFMINMAAFWMNLILVYLISCRMTGSPVLRLFAVFLYAASFISMEPFVLHKAYELQNTFILMVFCLVFRAFDSDRLRFFFFSAYGLSCLLAFLTHYYAYIFVAGICLVMFIHYTWVKKDLRKLAYFAAGTVAGVLFAVLIYPPIIHDLVTDHRSLEIQEKLGSPGALLQYKAEAALGIFIRYFLTPPFLLLMGASFTVMVILLVWKPAALDLKVLLRNRKLHYLAVYFALFYSLVFYVSPYNSLRYVAPVIPLFILLASSSLQVFSSSYQVRLVLVSSMFLLFFDVYALAKVGQGELSASALISQWRTDHFPDEPEKDSSFIVVSDRVREKMRPILYHAPPRPIAFCIERIPEELFSREGKMMVFLDSRFSGKLRSENISRLDRQGFKMVGRYGGFNLFLRDSVPVPRQSATASIP